MVSHMKTTIDIADDLLEEARRTAEAGRTTLRALVEAGLRREIERRSRRTAYRLADLSFGEGGMAPEFERGGWDAMRSEIYGMRN